MAFSPSAANSPRVASVQGLGACIDAEHGGFAEGSDSHPRGSRHCDIVGDSCGEVGQEQGGRGRVYGHIFEYPRRIVHVQAFDDHIVAGEDACATGIFGRLDRENEIKCKQRAENSSATSGFSRAIWWFTYKGIGTGSITFLVW